MNISSYLEEVKAEWPQIKWPTRRQAILYTILVIGFSVLVAAFMGALDYVFQEILQLII